MRILIVLKKWPGGVGSGLRNVSEEMRRMGHKVDIITREEDLKAYSFLESIAIIRKNVKRLMKKNDYDIIYTHDWSIAFPLFFPCPIFRKKHYCMFHGNQFGKGVFLQDIIGWLLSKHLVVMAFSIKRRFPKANFLYCGVDYDKRFKPLNKKRKYIGWLEKGTETISRGDIEEISKRVKMPLLIAKGIPYRKMNDFYNRCRVFISLPPRAAGFNACWLEAMAAGVPIILGSQEGMGEVLPFDKIFSEKDKVEKIIRIIRKPKRLNYRRWLIVRRLSWRNHTIKLLKIFSRSVV